MNEETCSTPTYVPIKAERVFDSCSDKDCITNVQVMLENGEELPTHCTLVKTRCVTIDSICINVEPIPFHRGYYSVDLTYTFGIELLCYDRACDAPTVMHGYATAAKSVILYGSESNTKTFSSNGTHIGETNRCCDVVNLPTAVCQCVDPIALETKIVNLCQNQEESGCCRKRAVVLTLGVFSVVELTRPVTMMVSAMPYTVPSKSCSGETDSPCEIFSRISFPTEQFLPQTADVFGTETTAENSCSCGGCCGIPN